MKLEWYKLSTTYPNAWAVILMQLNILLKQSVELLVMEDDYIFAKTKESSVPSPFVITSDILLRIFDEEGYWINTVCTELGTPWYFRLATKNGQVITSRHPFKTRNEALTYAIYVTIDHIEKYYTHEGAHN